MALFQGVLRGVVVPQCARRSGSLLHASGSSATRGIATSSAFDAPRLRVTLIHGDGIGPELCSSGVCCLFAYSSLLLWNCILIFWCLISFHLPSHLALSLSLSSCRCIQCSKGSGRLVNPGSFV
jgi:hypothetical protein